MKTWWREGMDVGFNLTRICRSIDAEDKGPWDVDGFRFKLSDKDMNDADYIEEQLWAMKENL